MYLSNISSIVLALVAFLSTTKGAPSLNVENRSIGSEPRIIGGEYIDIEKAPYQISIESYRKHYCGGAIISDTWALTTAHCVKTSGPLWAMQIRAGSARVLPVVEWQGTTHGINKMITHPSYNVQDIDYDVAVVQVSRDFVPSSRVAPVSLPAIGITEDRFIDYDQNAFATGWGAAQISDQFQTWNLKGVQIPLLPRTICGEKVENQGIKVTSRMICVAGNGKEGKCLGDNGGPLIHKETLIGLFSWFVRQCAELPSGFTNLFNEEIRSFIKTHTEL